MKNIHIENSYKIWNPYAMKKRITRMAYRKYKEIYAEQLLNRPYESMYFEWWLHNIGYHLTLPFIKFKKMNELNIRFKHVDLESWNND